MDVAVRVVDEHTRLCIAGGIDMEIVAAACNTAAYILSIVLEVHGEERNIAFCRAQIADTLDHVAALFRRGQQLRRRIIAHRHIVEVEAKVCSLVGQHPQEPVAGDRLQVGTGIADGGAEQDAVGTQTIHGIHDGGIMTAAAAGIGRSPGCPRWRA